MSRISNLLFNVSCIAILIAGTWITGCSTIKQPSQIQTESKESTISQHTPSPSNQESEQLTQTYQNRPSDLSKNTDELKLTNEPTKSNVPIISPLSSGDAMYCGNLQRTGEFNNGGIEPKGTEIWRIAVRAGPPVLSRGIVYFSGIGSKGNFVGAVDAAHGEQIWKFQKDDKDFNDKIYCLSAPSVSNGVVFSGGPEYFFSIDATTGKEKWRFPIGGCAGTPAVLNDAVYFGSSDHNFYALDSIAGKEKWRFTTTSVNLNSMAPVASNGLIFFSSYNEPDYNFHAVDVISGKEKWGKKLGGRTATVVNDIVFVGSIEGSVYALSADTGVEKWRFSTDERYDEIVGLAASGGNIYASSNTKILYALDLATGKEKWRFRTSKSGVGQASVSGSVVYFGDYDGNFYAVDVNTGKEKWKFTGDDMSMWSSPIISNGVIYVYCADDNIYAIG